MKRLYLVMLVVCTVLISLALLAVYAEPLFVLSAKRSEGSNTARSVGETHVENMTVAIETSLLRAEVVVEMLPVAELDRRGLSGALSARIRDSLLLMEFESAKIGIHELRQIATIEAERVLPPGTLRDLHVWNFVSRSPEKP